MYQGSLSEIQLTNFKSFRKTSNFPIRPITLIFGPNSSGKSSFIQSLLMLQQSVSNNKPYDLTMNGPLINLGGFQNVIFQHKIQKKFSVAFTFNLNDRLDIAFGSTLLELPYNMEISEKLKDFLRLIHKYKKISVTTVFENGISSVLNKIIIHLGDEKKPLLSYSFHDLTYPYDTLNQETSYWVNHDHVFWKDYWRFCSENPDYKILEDMTKQIDRWLEDDDSFLHLLADNVTEYDFITPERLKEFMEHGINDSFKKEMNKARKFFDNVKHNLSGFDQAIEIFKLYNLTESGLPLENFTSFVVECIYSTQIRWDKIDEDRADKPYILFLLLTQYLSEFLVRCKYIGPIREFPSRFYSSSAMSNDYDIKGSNMPATLFDQPELLKIINDDLRKFNQKYYLKIAEFKSDEPSLNEIIYTLQFINRNTGVWSNFTEVGFGFSQLLPIITTLRSSKDNLIMIEQPELHLHPAMQSELGDLFISSIFDENRKIINSLIVETHSEHVMLRILRRIRETTEGKNTATPPISPEDVSVLYVSPDDRGSQVTHIPITKDGDFDKDWPNGFFDERDKELFF
jgi:AAA15 family ATPase/GTPase